MDAERMLYEHGGGTDQPLGLIRSDYSYDFPDSVLIVPHANWRGAYETSTFADGNADRCKTVWLPSSEVVRRDSTGRVYTLPLDAPDTTQARCIERDFPGAYMGMTRLLKRQTVYGPNAWHGSLVQDGSDASGLSYRRNRYYDPSTGRFTQEDPIGIAGGLNVYGFAGGDPVNYSDPYGLCPKDLQGEDGNCPGGISVAEWQAVEATYSHMTHEASIRTRGLLWSGNVHGYSAETAQFGRVTTGEPETIQINRTRRGNSDSPYRGSVFANPEKLARTLLHEGTHVEQLKQAPRGQKAAFLEANEKRLDREAYRYERENYVP